MKKLLVILLVCFLSGCVHKIDIEQGNVISPGMLHQLHPGMSKNQVLNILGNPVLVNTFSDNQLDYVYALKPGYGHLQERYITLTFQNNILKDIKSNL
jgi:outer membrane protein assembly factor BamE